MGKGSKRRPGDNKAYDRGYERIFGQNPFKGGSLETDSKEDNTSLEKDSK